MQRAKEALIRIRDRCVVYISYIERMNVSARIYSKRLASLTSLLWSTAIPYDSGGASDADRTSDNKSSASLNYSMHVDPFITLRHAIRSMYGCESRHIESMPMHEVSKGQTPWPRVVEVFALINHPKAKRAYAWSFKEGNVIESVAVLEIPPVNSPQTAVKAAIAAKARRQ
jgi:hypothetical protein